MLDYSEEDLIKIYAVMRSLFRFAEFVKMKSPDSLIENEKRIFIKHLSVLKVEDILYVAKNFNQYYDQQDTQTALDTEHMVNEFEKYINNLN